MLKNIIKSAEEFLKIYSEKGMDVLLNCFDYPQFQEIISNLKMLTKENLGIRHNNHTKYFKDGKISYFNIREDNNMCIGVFCLSKGTRLSLHDHPSMMVLSKIIEGKIQRRNMDLVNHAEQFKFAKKVYLDNDLSSIGTLLDAKLESDKIYNTGDLLHLAPFKGNIHSFYAHEDTALLDILLPNYDNEERFCNFYYELDPDTDFYEAGIYLEDNLKLSDSKTEQEDEASKSLSSEEKQSIKLVYALPPSDLDIVLLEYEGESLV